MSVVVEPPRVRWACPLWGALLAAIVLAACEGEKAAVLAEPQTTAFEPVAAPAAGQSTIVVSATASSGLAVRFRSLTPSVCTVDAGGLVTGLSSGICTIAADQSGDDRFAPAPRVTLDIDFTLTAETLAFTRVPALAVFDRGTVVAVHSAGADVLYASDSPSVCVVDAESGLVEALTLGTCAVSCAAGTLRAATTIAVAEASIPTVPGTPTGIAAFAGAARDTVVVRVGGTAAGGSRIVGYAVDSSPAGLVADGTSPSVTVVCPGGCAGYSFRVVAANLVGTGLPSVFVHVRTRYDVVATFYEPDTQPNNSVFVGSYVLDGTTGTVSELRGRLSESMTGGDTPYPADTMTWLPLDNQLSSLPTAVDGADAVLVTTFLLNTTNTLSPAPRFGGIDGWSPGTGMALHYGYPGDNPGNAYTRIFVDRRNPTASPTPAQIAWLAYADCAPGGMMGATCMTGTSEAAYGTVGSMSGYPLSQTTNQSKTVLQGDDL